MIIKKCNNCGNDFERKYNNQKYCSISCRESKQKTVFGKEYYENNKIRYNIKRKEKRHILGISKFYSGDQRIRRAGISEKDITGKPNRDKWRYKSRGKEYFEGWNVIRKEIYKRDNWTCRIPECGIKCHGNGNKDKIQCHHIDYDIKNNNPSNLITLCASCHMRTNFNREYWKDYFMNMVKK